jgi:hypothetical protein
MVRDVGSKVIIAPFYVSSVVLPLSVSSMETMLVQGYTPIGVYQTAARRIFFVGQVAYPPTGTSGLCCPKFPTPLEPETHLAALEGSSSRFVDLKF